MRLEKPLFLALALVGGVAGCHLPGGGAQVQTVKKPADEPIAQRSSTFVAFGDFRAKAGVGPDIQPEMAKRYREEARLSYQKAIEIDPQYLPAYTALARLSAATEDNTQAIAAYKKALTLPGASKDASLWHELGVCQCRLKEWGPASESLKKACEHDPSNRPYANALGFTLARAERFQESYECLARAAGPAKAHYNLARVLHHMNKNDLARQHALLALDKEPTLKDAQTLLAELEGKSAPSAIQTVGHTEMAPRPGNEAPVAGATAPEANGPGIAVPPLPVINNKERRP